MTVTKSIKKNILKTANMLLNSIYYGFKLTNCIIQSNFINSLSELYT